MTAYYNENDPYAAQWLRNLIAAGHIAPGEVDERSILDVRADDIRGFKQCHFFAGIGVWSYALRLAGWPDDREVWTGSCPCQPFSAAGKRGGVEDERHLWPEFFRLISQCQPGVVFGEQVASKDGLAWLDIVSADLERAGYACGAVDTCAAGFGAPHIRQRLYFVADSGRTQAHGITGTCSEVRSLANSNGRNASAEGLQRSREHGFEQEDGGAGSVELADAAHERVNGSGHGGPERRCEPSDRGELGDTDESGRTPGRVHRGREAKKERPGRTTARSGDAGPCSGFWRDADWLPCIDGKARPVEPGTFPLAHGATARVGRLRAYGNAINARQAAGFISAFLAQP